MGQRGQRIFFRRLCPLSPSSHHGSVPVAVTSLFLTNTVSPVRTWLIIRYERFREIQKEGDRGALSIQSSPGWAHVAKVIVPDFDSGIGLSYRPARLHRLTPSQGLWIWLLDFLSLHPSWRASTAYYMKIGTLEKLIFFAHSSYSK